MNNTQRIEALEAKVVELEAKIEAMSAQRVRSGNKERDYGPASEKQMTERMALRILVGRYRTWSVRKIADECGLSRGQVYSLKGGYTFKTAHKTADRILERRAQRSLNAQ